MKSALAISKMFVVATALLIVLTSCGNKEVKPSLSADESQALVESVESAPQATGGFDVPVNTPDKVSYTLSSPSNFTPGKFASGYLPGQLNQKFTVSISNNSPAELDLATLIVIGSTAAGACVDIFDGDHVMEGAPTTPLSIGSSISFGWGLSCPGKAGDELSLILSNAGVNYVEVKGKLA